MTAGGSDHDKSGKRSSSRIGRKFTAIMVASSVYGFQTDLDQICGVLQGYGYTVWSNHLGTIATHPGRSNLDNCLEAVRQCDVFLGIIRPFYLDSATLTSLVVVSRRQKTR